LADGVDRGFEYLRSVHWEDYFRRGWPTGALESIERLIDAFASSDPAGREKMTQQVDRSFAGVFSGYAMRAAMESIRRNDPELLKRGLIALAIENAKTDWRDTLPYLALIYHSAGKLNVNASDLFRNTATIVFPQFQRLLEGFLNRREEMRSIEYFHYKEAGAGDTFSYLYVEPPSHIPSRFERKTRMFLRRLRQFLIQQFRGLLCRPTWGEMRKMSTRWIGLSGVKAASGHTGKRHGHS